MKQLRYGILSTSSIAPRMIAALRQSGAGEAVALSSRSLEKAKEYAKLWDIPRSYGDHMALLEDPQVDIVYISTVNAQHYPWAKAALEHGKHVLCEKPCTITSAQTRELFSLAEEKGLFLMEAEKMLFLPAILEVKRRIDAGELGKIQMITMSHSFAASYNTWMYDAAAGGGPLLSSGIYAVELLLWLFGGIRDLQAVASFHENGLEQQYVITGHAGEDILFSAKNSTLASLDNTAKIYGTKGYAEIPEYWKARKAIFHLESGMETAEFPCEHELVYEAQHVAQCIRSGKRTSDVVTPQLSIDAIGVLEQVRSMWEM